MAAETDNFTSARGELGSGWIARKISEENPSHYIDSSSGSGLSHPIFVFIVSLLLFVSSVSCTARRSELPAANSRLVELRPTELDPHDPDRNEFDRLTLLSAFELRSRDSRFGGLSGLAVGVDGKLYAVSDRGYWFSAQMRFDMEGRLVDPKDWEIQPILSTSGAPVAAPLYDAEALSRAPDGSFIVAFEQVHRIWRYSAPPDPFSSLPLSVPVPPELAKAPTNGGIEAATVLPGGRILAITEEWANPDGTFKGWLIEEGRFSELSYLPSEGFRASDCAALKNGDVLVLERRYVPFGILYARLKLVRADDIQPGAKLVGEELLRLGYPVQVDNFEGVAVQEDPIKGTTIYIVSDDNYHPFQRTLLLQFRLAPPN